MIGWNFNIAVAVYIYLPWKKTYLLCKNLYLFTDQSIFDIKNFTGKKQQYQTWILIKDETPF